LRPPQQCSNIRFQKAINGVFNTSSGAQWYDLNPSTLNFSSGDAVLFQTNELPTEKYPNYSYKSNPLTPDTFLLKIVNTSYYKAYSPSAASLAGSVSAASIQTSPPIEDDNISIIFTETSETSAIYMSGILKFDTFVYYYNNIDDFYTKKYSDRIFVKPGDAFAIFLIDTFPYFTQGLNIFPEFNISGQEPLDKIFKFYPNPFKYQKNSEFYMDYSGKEIMVFDNIKPGAEFKVLSVDGRLIFKESSIPEKSPDGISYRYYWYLKNLQGKAISSGIYIFITTDRYNNIQINKIAILR